jgi:aryl-alcohol dehydrogenase-like predicted oxidoreductase
MHPAQEKAGVPRSPRISAGQLDRLRPQLTEYEELYAELGHQPSRVALAWLLQRTRPTTSPRRSGRM